MAHDKNGNLLQAGDLVKIMAVVEKVQPGDEFCNINLVTVEGRKPDGLKERIGAINAAVLEKIELTEQQLEDLTSG